MQSPYSYTRDTHQKLEQPSFYKNLIISPTDLKNNHLIVIQLAVTFLTDHLLYDCTLKKGAQALAVESSIQLLSDWNTPKWLAGPLAPGPAGHPVKNLYQSAHNL